MLIALSVVHGLLLGTFVPATLMIIFRNLPMGWWLPAIAIYSIRVGFALDTSTSAVGFYVEHLGWQWLYWQGVLDGAADGIDGLSRDAGRSRSIARCCGMPTGAAYCCWVPAFR